MSDATIGVVNMPENITRIKIDNVIAWVDKMRDSGKKHTEIAPIDAPMFDECLYVFNCPVLSVPCDVWQIAYDGFARPREVDNETFISIFGKTAEVVANDGKDVRWSISRSYNINGHNFGGLLLYVFDDGTKADAKALFHPGLDYEKFGDDHVWEMLVGKYSDYVSFSNSLMAAKNVRLIDEPLSRQRRRMLERKGGVRYKVLDIEPFKEQVRRETEPGESQLQRALHICRGHFATYTDDNPLFGKVTGTFWRPMHVRGNSASGVVVKDYNIKL